MLLWLKVARRGNIVHTRTVVSRRQHARDQTTTPTTTTTTTTARTMLAAFPALYLYPLNADSFVKHINLTNNQRVKIGRQTNARTVPAENNGYFDSKVLSRQHAEVWEDNAKVCF